MERCFNMREGLDRKDDTLPWRMMNEVQRDLDMDDAILSKELLDGMLDEYYRLHEWDLASGNPTEEVLRSLGLESVLEA